MAVFFQKQSDGSIRSCYVEPGQVIDSLEDIEINAPTQTMLTKMTKDSLLGLLRNLGLRITNASKLTKDRIANRIVQDFATLTTQAGKLQTDKQDVDKTDADAASSSKDKDYSDGDTDPEFKTEKTEEPYAALD